MSKANEALVDVRRWLCDNLSDGDAGKVCGMLSVVSRRIAGIEEENARLRELVREMWGGYADPSCEECPLKDNPACVDCPICAREAAVIDRMRELGVEVD